jgi:RNA polymerase sigma factor (sigma-70 family)
MNAHTASFRGGSVVHADYQPLTATHLQESLQESFKASLQTSLQASLPATALRETDRQLLDRIADGDRPAMQTLYRRHHLSVYRFVRRLVGDNVMAEDVVSEVFLSVWRHAAQFEGRSQVSSWLLAIARFSAISTLRRRRKDIMLDEDEVAHVPDNADDPEMVMQKNDRVTVLRQCLTHLSHDHRTIIDLVYYHDKSIDEVARIVGVPKNTVKTRMFYARKRMQGLLAEAGFDGNQPRHCPIKSHSFDGETVMLNSTHLVRYAGAAFMVAAATLLSTAARSQVLAIVNDSGAPQVIRVALADRDAGDDATSDLPANLRRQVVSYPTSESPGTIVVDTPNTYLYFVLAGGKAIRYGIGIGRDGFTWAGVKTIERKSEWPDWIPPTEMLQRQPYLPRFMAGGPGNPLGARAMYLGGTVYRIHGTNNPATIGKRVSSGCIRLANEDVVDLYNQTHVGTKVVVLPMHKDLTVRPLPVVSHRAEAFSSSQLY